MYMCLYIHTHTHTWNIHTIRFCPRVIDDKAGACRYTSLVHAALLAYQSLCSTVSVSGVKASLVQQR